MPAGAVRGGRVAVAVLVTIAIGVASGLRTTPPLGSRTARADVRPNIVLIMTDDMRWDELENMPKTMAFLAAQGVRFTQAFIPNSLCCPSRTSLLTGQYSNHNGVWNNAAPYGGFPAFARGYTRPDGVVVPQHETHTIAVTLHDAGYRTGLVGKYLNQYGTGNAGSLAARPGWDVWDAFLNNPNYFNYTLDHYGTAVKHGAAAVDYSTDVLAADAVSFINTAPSTQPFFLAFTPYAPHAPFRPAPRYATSLPACKAGHLPPGCYRNYTSPNIAEADVSDKPAWVQALAPGSGAGWNTTRKKQELTLLSVDDAVDQIRLALQARGLLSNTLVVFTSDNSVSGGSHRWNNKQSPWDEAIHVPLLIRYDPLTSTRAGAVDATDLPLNIDLAPTFTELAGATPPTDEWAYDGESLVPEIAGTGSIARTSFPLEHLVGGNEAGENAPSHPPTYCGVRTNGDPDIPGRWMYVRYDTGEEELYDLVADPWQLTSLDADPTYDPERLALRALAEQLCAPVPPGFSWG
jgi:N-acetylglucosamine-6-sulfatase